MFRVASCCVPSWLLCVLERAYPFLNSVLLGLWPTSSRGARRPCPTCALTQRQALKACWPCCQRRCNTVRRSTMRWGHAGGWWHACVFVYLCVLIAHTVHLCVCVSVALHVFWHSYVWIGVNFQLVDISCYLFYSHQTWMKKHLNKKTVMFVLTCFWLEYALSEVCHNGQ